MIAGDRFFDLTYRRRHLVALDDRFVELRRVIELLRFPERFWQVESEKEYDVDLRVTRFEGQSIRGSASVQFSGAGVGLIRESSWLEDRRIRYELVMSSVA